MGKSTSHGYAQIASSGGALTSQNAMQLTIALAAALVVALLQIGGPQQPTSLS